ncbi:small subunit ribosomal protein 5 (apicoplast) [Plasmodium gonderi]|uniref:Small subunit ribosomal protein 5 n=1 Tax=Plasmodium gonderi TaxID=77519 RepID=A0A1Y1JWR1_PLAGO|nr:small subunit ribosomal protein 5 [Plasmodium gonderi]BBB58256.1 small subunit ribosomal protein 5 [Plasmodium gonderi]GAW84753.1 small subunit ribosomal protein 5 [Plasmodium gonderi]
MMVISRNNINNNYYLLYYILILLKSIFIIIKFKIKKNFNNYLFIIYIKLLFLYLKLYYFINIFNSYFYINIYYNLNYIYFYIYKYNNNIKSKYNILNNNIIEKIIEIKKISYTIKKGRINRYKVILLIGNKQGWIGVGVGKNINVNKAIILSRNKALNNIYYFKYSLLNIYKLKYIYINFNKLCIKIQFNIYNYVDIRFLLLKYLLECLGYLNCKIIIYYNIMLNKYNLLNKILLILFNIF